MTDIADPPAVEPIHSQEQPEAYLGDGLYVRRTHYGDVVLRAPREAGDHYVVLEPPVLRDFLAWLQATR